MDVGGRVNPRVRCEVRRGDGGAGQRRKRAEWAAAYLCNCQRLSDGWGERTGPSRHMPSASRLMRIVQSKTALERAWRVIQENAQTSTSDEVKAEVQQFSENATANINALSAKLSGRSFKFPKARGIPIAKQNPDGTKNKNKIRPIVLAPLPSRIVQRTILEALGTVAALQPYAENEYSFGGIRKKHKDGLAAVPAAVEAVLKAIGGGATHVAFADIRAFFTKIPKPVVTKIVADATADPEFMSLFEDAIRVELENMAELKEKVHDFPIEAIGVAQGNSLSPLLGNILLHDFDRQMNAGDCTCIRYIDDFIILAPSAAAAKAKMRLAVRLLSNFEMTLSEEKSTREPIAITDKFDFLGIEFNNGLLRPSQKAILKLESNVKARFNQSLQAMRGTKSGQQMPKRHSLIATLNRVDGIIRGWGKHYKFCNDNALFQRIDSRLQTSIRQFIGEYRNIRKRRDPSGAAGLLGIDELGRQRRQPLTWPSKRKILISETALDELPKEDA
ncbi:reverse transcriptase domain-containing protein [Mesorhizobium sp. RMAD-H1]|uniref:reverse transcriptase domain-containing protein n=1 Tax=Mesorhizobium sp. RMAD-H1 TaxID=2587065 RepID=UPI00161384B3|nr:reverse transcriptase domain-containing protein [Mesorhizobium sp. RMAD-H1]MBB2969771.1 retron-type reverse transcriptase [Mesorhizobium sp. RMAD-H1]